MGLDGPEPGGYPGNRRFAECLRTCGAVTNRLQVDKQLTGRDSETQCARYRAATVRERTREMRNWLGIVNHLFPRGGHLVLRSGGEKRKAFGGALRGLRE